MAAYVEKRTARLTNFGTPNISATTTEGNEGPSRIDYAGACPQVVAR